MENINFNGHNIVLGSLFLTTGDTSYIEQTVIDGDSAGSVITFKSRENNTAEVAGFTITNGWITNGENGGGIYCLDSSPKILDNIISTNGIRFYGDDHTWPIGGGIICYGGDSYIKGNSINNTNCTGYISMSGGIVCVYSSAIIIHNNVTDNYPDGIVCLMSEVDIIDNIVNANINEKGITLQTSHSNIKSNIIFGNEQGIWANRSEYNLANNIIRDNVNGINMTDYSYMNSINNSYYSNENAGVHCRFQSVLHLKNDIFRNNSFNIIEHNAANIIVTYSNLEGGYPGEGNIDVDPLFRDPENGDFHLMAIECGDLYDSPCIDMGWPNILDSLLDCDWGLGGLRSDMGAYGGGDSAEVGIDDIITRLPSRYHLKQNYPNPFNASTIIKYELPYQSHVTIEIYDILGRRVVTIQDGLQAAGYHQVLWHAEDISSGIYFYKLQAGDYIETKKMMLLK